MKEDILEQIVEDWFVAQSGWFVKHNVKYRPNSAQRGYNTKQDSVHSDIDILAISKKGRGVNKVAVVSCKSWQGGFNVDKWVKVFKQKATYRVRTIEFAPREKWKSFRELCFDKWTKAFLDKIEEETGQRALTYYIVVTRRKGTKSEQGIEMPDKIKRRFEKFGGKIELKLITLEYILNAFRERSNEKQTTAVEMTSVGRLLQLINAAGLMVVNKDLEKIVKRLIAKLERHQPHDEVLMEQCESIKKYLS